MWTAITLVERGDQLNRIRLLDIHGVATPTFAHRLIQQAEAEAKRRRRGGEAEAEGRRRGGGGQGQVEAPATPLFHDLGWLHREHRSQGSQDHREPAYSRCSCSISATRKDSSSA